MKTKAKELIIVGAGGLGREIFSWVADSLCVKKDTSYNLKGFIDDDTNSLNSFNYPCKIIRTIKHELSGMVCHP